MFRKITDILFMLATTAIGFMAVLGYYTPHTYNMYVFYTWVFLISNMLLLFIGDSVIMESAVDNYRKMGSPNALGTGPMAFVTIVKVCLIFTFAAFAWYWLASALTFNLAATWSLRQQREKYVETLIPKGKKDGQDRNA